MTFHLTNSLMDITISEKTLQFKKPARTSRGEYTEHKMYVIHVDDEESGRHGLGELAPLPDLSCDRNAYPTAQRVLDMIVESFVHSYDWHEYLRPCPALLFALESALSAFNNDKELYDTPFARGEVGIPFNGLVWMDTYDNMLCQMEEKINAGFKCIKLKIGAIDFDKELDLIRIIREHFPKDKIEIRVDANGAFSANDVMQRLDALAKYDLHSIEQPIKALWHESGEVKSWQEMARLCRETPLPIALDEELIGLNMREDKVRMLNEIRPQYIVIKPMLHGGISGTREWVSLANERNIGSWITSALESNIGLQSVALLAASIYGPDITFPQGLGTGQLYVKNIPMQTELRGNMMFFSPDLSKNR